jgi:hypothetical protein
VGVLQIYDILTIFYRVYWQRLPVEHSDNFRQIIMVLAYAIALMLSFFSTTITKDIFNQ